MAWVFSCSRSHNGLREIRKCRVTRKGNQPRTKLANSSTRNPREDRHEATSASSLLFLVLYVPIPFASSISFLHPALPPCRYMRLHLGDARCSWQRVLLRRERNKWLRGFCRRHQGCINFPCRGHLLFTLDVIRNSKEASSLFRSVFFKSTISPPMRELFRAVKDSASKGAFYIQLNDFDGP